MASDKRSGSSKHARQTKSAHDVVPAAAAGDGEAKPLPKSTQQQQLDAENSVGEILLQPLQSVAVKPQNGKLTRRMSLCWLWLLKNCQKLPPSSTYKFPMAPLMSFLDTREYEEVRSDLKRLNAMQVEWHNTRDDEASWGVSSFLAQVEIRRSKAGNTIEIALPPVIENTIRQKRTFSELNLLIARSLRLTAAMSLYRICIAYETNPSHVTFRSTPEDWEPRLSGQPRTVDSKAFEYKFWKRDVLKPAVAEINQLTDIDVELIEHKSGRKVTEIQFRVTSKAQGSLELLDGSSPETEILQEIEAMGIRHSEAVVMLRNHGHDRIERNLRYTRERQRIMGDRLQSLAKYLKSAVREDYAANATHEPIEMGDQKAARKVPNVQAKKVAKAEALRAEYESARRARAEEMFQEMSRKDSDGLWDQYLEHLAGSDNKTLAKSARLKGLQNRMVRIDFLSWLADMTWGEITQDQLFEYLLLKQA